MTNDSGRGSIFTRRRGVNFRASLTVPTFGDSKRAPWRLSSTGASGKLALIAAQPVADQALTQALNDKPKATLGLTSSQPRCRGVALGYWSVHRGVLSWRQQSRCRRKGDSAVTAFFGLIRPRGQVGSPGEAAQAGTTTAKARQVPGTPFNSWSPRSVKVMMRLPTMFLWTVSLASTSPVPARSQIRCPAACGPGRNRGPPTGVRSGVGPPRTPGRAAQCRSPGRRGWSRLLSGCSGSQERRSRSRPIEPPCPRHAFELVLAPLHEVDP